jgi:DNA helicase HerA-like ATPase
MTAQFPIAMTSKLDPIEFYLAMANRHGMIAGATGTGKTVTLQKIAEQFSQAGVSVFTADVKGDLAGIAFPANNNPKVKARLEELKIKDYTPQACPVVFWDIYGKEGHPLRATISEMGPLLLGRLLNLNDTQQGVLNATFSYADDEGLLLIDLKDLRSLLEWMQHNASSLQGKYGNISSASIGAIQRGLLTLQEAGGDNFFGEPAFRIENLFQKNASGQGLVHILDATKLINDPLLYSTFLLWLLSDLFETLPEVGDLDKPKLVFFFDEAHLLFNSAPKPLMEKIQQLVRLIRSKGVGVYFVSQSPLDIPETVLGQLGNRIQHALRAFTPRDQKAIKAAAQTFRQNPKLDLEAAIQQMGVGEALISLLDTAGTPAMVERTKVIPPVSRIGAISAEERTQLMNQSPFAGIYDKPVDRESAYEILAKRTADKQQVVETVEANGNTEKRGPGRPRQSMAEAMVTSAARSFGTQIGRQILRGIMGSIFSNKK